MKLTIARFDAVAFRFAVSSIMRSCANKHSERHQRLFSKPLPVPEMSPLLTVSALCFSSIDFLYGALFVASCTGSSPTHPSYPSSGNTYRGKWYAADTNAALPSPLRPSADHVSRF